MEYSVYIHITPNNKFYVGITKQKPVKRWLNGKGYQKQSYFYNAILKYGWKNIKHIIVYSNLTKEEAENKEIILIKLLKSNKRKYGYNIENGGCANKVSDQTKIKLHNANIGKHHNKDTCKRLSELEKARWQNEEYRQNQINKRLGQLAWNKGKTTPENVREKQRIAKLGKYTGDKHWNSKKVINVDTGKIYNSFGEIAKELNLKNASHIVEVCKGKRNNAYGYHWKYYN